MNSFVSYLNTLHNYNAQNSNVFGEKNIESEFYEKIMVNNPICDFICNQLTNGNPHIIVLTGHAGDGKTSLMYQVLKKLGHDFDAKNKKFSIKISNSCNCLCIKDFSELSDEEKQLTMKEIGNAQKNGDYVFLVANTGPLINNFPYAYEDVNAKDVEAKLIDLMDENSGTVETLFGLKICIINIVAVNNSFFSKEFIDNIVAEKLWEDCKCCSKKSYCPILRNIKLIRSNKNKVEQFINDHYIWLSEYGERLTIRSMTQQLSYMITAGLNCKEVQPFEDFLLLSSNLFFGYRGTKVDEKSLEINSIKQAYDCKYDKKRLRVDEELFISKNYKELVSDDIEQIIKKSEISYGHLEGWQNMIKRMYLFYNIQTNEDKILQDYEDVFSNQYRNYLDLKYSDNPVPKTILSLIRDALSMLNIGIIVSNSKYIPITLNRDSSFVQNVQLVVDEIKGNKILLIKEPSNYSKYLNENGYNDIYITIYGEKINQKLNLPLFDYFDDLKKGIINTNVDAQLSKGLEIIKSEILRIVQKSQDNEEINLVVTDGNDYKEITFSINDNKIEM